MSRRNRRNPKLGRKLQKYKMGDLNPWGSSKSGDFLDEQVANYDSMSRKALSRHFADDTITGTGPYYGTVWRIEEGSDPDSIVDHAGAPTPGNKVKKLTKVKVYIPTIHSMLNEPKSTKDHFNIDKLHTFVAIHADIKRPQVGDIVLVDYMNLRNLQGPILIDVVQPLKQVALKDAPKIEASVRAEFDRCAQHSAGCLVDPETPAGTIISQMQRPPVGIFAPTGKSKRALIISDEASAAVQGKIMQQFLAETARGRIGGFRGITSKNSPPDLVTATKFNSPAHWVSQDGLNQLTETYFLDKNNDGVFEDVPDLIIIMLGTIGARAAGAGITTSAANSQAEGLRHFPLLGGVRSTAYNPVVISKPLHTMTNQLEEPPTISVTPDSLTLEQEEEILRKVYPVAYLLAKLRQMAPRANILWIGAPPHVTGRSGFGSSERTIVYPVSQTDDNPQPANWPDIGGAKSLASNYHHKNISAFSPAQINKDIESTFARLDDYLLNSRIFEASPNRRSLGYGTKAFFIDPAKDYKKLINKYTLLGTSVGKDTISPSQIARVGERDGITLDREGAIELVVNLATKATLFGNKKDLPLASTARSRLLAKDKEKIKAFQEASDKQEDLKRRLEEISKELADIPQPPSLQDQSRIAELETEKIAIENEYAMAKETASDDLMTAKAGYESNLESIRDSKQRLAEHTQQAMETGCGDKVGKDLERCLNNHPQLGAAIKAARQNIETLEKDNIAKEEKIFGNSSQCAPWKKCKQGTKSRVSSANGNVSARNAFTTTMVPKHIDDINWTRVPASLKNKYSGKFIVLAKGEKTVAISLEELSIDSHFQVKFAGALAGVAETMRLYWKSHPQISDAKIRVTSHARMSDTSKNHNAAQHNKLLDPDIAGAEGAQHGSTEDGTAAAMDFQIWVKYEGGDNKYHHLPTHIVWAGTLMLMRHARIPGRCGIYLSTRMKENFPNAVPESRNGTPIKEGASDDPTRFTDLWTPAYRQMGRPSGRAVCSYTPGGVHFDFGAPDRRGGKTSCFSVQTAGTWFRVKATDHGKRGNNDIKSDKGGIKYIWQHLEGKPVTAAHGAEKVANIGGFRAKDNTYSEEDRKLMLKFFRGWFDIAKGPWTNKSLPPNPPGFPIYIPPEGLPNWMQVLGQIQHTTGQVPGTIELDSK